mgnify:FL=1
MSQMEQNKEYSIRIDGIKPIDFTITPVYADDNIPEKELKRLDHFEISGKLPADCKWELYTREKI